MGRGPGVRGIGGSIQIDFRYKGQRCRERLRLSPTPQNIKYAKRLKAAIEHEIATGIFDYAKHFPRSRRTVERGGRLGYCLEAFLVRCRVSPETQDEYREYVGLVPVSLKEKPINQITQRDIEAWLEPLNLSRKRQNNLLIPLRGAFRKAHRDGEIKQNPLLGLRTEARKTETQIDPFSKAEVGKLSGAYLGPMWALWAWTGLRSGEIAGLEWSDLEASGDALHIRRAMRGGREKGPKTRSGSRRVVLLQPGRDALGCPAQGRIYINPATGRPFDTDRQIREAFKRACREADVRYRYPYQLRHTFASWALSSGENPLWVAKQMGHKDVSMVLRVYGRYIPEMDPLAGTRMVK